MTAPIRILFVSLTNDTGGERIVAEMGRSGGLCAVLAMGNCLAMRSKFVAARFVLPSWGGTYWAGFVLHRHLARVSKAWEPDLVVPLDEMTAVQLRNLAIEARIPVLLRDRLVRSLGDPEHYATICSRGRLIELAGQLGVPVPAYARVGSLAMALAAAHGLSFPVVLKRDLTSGNGGVVIAQNPGELAKAFASASRKAALKRLARRLCGLGEETGAALTLQAFVAGRLAMHTVACWRGTVLEGVSFAAEKCHPEPIGSSTMLRWTDHAGMADAAGILVAALKCSGFVSFDFMLRPEGQAELIEMNPRPIGSSHLGCLFGHDVFAALLAHMGGADYRAPRAVLAQKHIIALFPKELESNPDSPALQASSGILHDVPLDDPDVLAAQLQKLAQRHPAHARRLRQIGPPQREKPQIVLNPRHLAR